MVSTTTPWNGTMNITNPYWIGWDRVFDKLSNIQSDTFPPYNVVKLENDDNYLIELAVAGYKQENLNIEYSDGNITISGEKKDHENEYLHKGISSRNFKKVFSLAEHMEVTGAFIEDGILNILIVRNLPEAKKPRNIQIGTNGYKSKRPQIKDK